MARTETPWGAWDPLPVDEVAALFRTIAAPWWIAGGYAIELEVGRPLREHGDIDVLLLRRDQAALHGAVPGWECWAAHPLRALRRWPPGQRLPDAVHDIWCRPGPDAPWRLQVILDESDEDDWVSRRHRGLRRPIGSIGRRSAAGVPYVAPEIQLLYKGKAPLPKDETDFAAVLPLLDRGQRRWLHDALALVYGPHPWQDRLAAP